MLEHGGLTGPCWGDIVIQVFAILQLQTGSRYHRHLPIPHLPRAPFQYTLFPCLTVSIIIATAVLRGE